MAIVSSHILDSVNGESAIGVRSQLFIVGVDQRRTELFDTMTNEEGRIVEEVDVGSLNVAAADCVECELVFDCGSYFARRSIQTDSPQNVKTVVIRFVMDNPDKRYHIPIMLSPHSYSVWWSK